MIDNLPISYDFHGDVPFSVPFSELRPEDIDIYLDVDTYIGAQTCMQRCDHCWFVNDPRSQNLSFRAEGPAIYEALVRQGFKVFPRYADSFAYDGEFLRLYSRTGIRTYYSGKEKAPTQVMKAGEAWTSGRPLLKSNYKQLLDLAREHGYETITITFHGTLDDRLKLAPHATYPLKGVFRGVDFEEVVKKIQTYSPPTAAAESEKSLSRFRINVGVTVGRHNCSREMLIRYLRYFDALGIAGVRFNRFFDHGHRHPDLALSDSEVETFYLDIKWIHSQLPFRSQLGISEDFGTAGIGVMEFPSTVGWCRASRQLFWITPTKDANDTLRSGGSARQIGDVVACNHSFEPILGALWQVPPEHSPARYEVRFDHAAIDAFTAKRTNGIIKNGCFAREVMAEAEAARTKHAGYGLAARVPAASLSTPFVRFDTVAMRDASQHRPPDR